MSVPVARIGDLAEQIRGVTYGKQDASQTQKPGYLPVLRAGNITDNGLVFEDLVFVPAARISDKQRVRRHDVVIAASSGSLDVVGKAAPALADFDGGFGAFCKVLRPNSKVHPAYLAHFLKTPDYRRRVSALAAGANINNLRNEHLDEMRLPLPSLPEQRRIAAILDRAEELRAKRRTALAQLDGLAQSVFMEMFGDPLENPFKYSVQPLIELVDSSRPITYGILKPGPDQVEGVKYVRVVDMKDGGIDLSGIRRTTPDISRAYRRSVLRSGDVLLSIRGHVGRLGVVPTELDGANITQDTARLAMCGMSHVFLREYLRTPTLQRWMVQRTKGVAVRGINLTDVKVMPVLVPPEKTQTAFAVRVAALDSIRTEQRLSRDGTSALFASLQHRAFRGEL